MQVIDKIAYIYIQNQKILSSLSKGKDTYYIPGGKREKSETDEQTLIREVKEELSVDIQKETIQYYGTFEAQAHGKAEGIIVKMTCYTADYAGILKPNSEIQELRWLTSKDMDKISPVDKLIFQDLIKKGYLE
ncbi:MAG: NUDIX hydrolase [Clostridia bacterium]